MRPIEKPLTVFPLCGWAAVSMRVFFAACAIASLGGPIAWLVHQPDWSGYQQISLVAGAVVAALFVRGITRVSRYQIELHSDFIRYQTDGASIDLHFADIEGFRILPTQYFRTLLIVPKDKQHKKIELALVYARNAELHAFLNANFENLDEREMESERSEIASNQELGLSEAERLKQLARTKKLTFVLNFTAYVVGILGVFRPQPYSLIMGTLLVLPVVGLLVLIYFRGLVRFDDGSKKSAYPNIGPVMLMAPVALAARGAGIQMNIADWDAVWGPLATISLIAAAIVFWFVPQTRRKISTMIAVIVGSVAYGYGALIHCNISYDRSTPTAYQAKIIDKSGSSERQFVSVVVGPLGEVRSTRLMASSTAHDTYLIGDDVRVLRFEGKFGIPWFYVSEKPSRRTDPRK